MALLDWLDEQRSADVEVDTVRAVIGGSVQPAVAGPAAPSPPNGANGVRNTSLEDDVDGDGAPDCWIASTPADTAASWTRTSAAHEGSAAQLVEVVARVEGEPRLAIVEDLGQCTPSVVSGHRYRITAWYRSTVPVWLTTHTRVATTFSYWEKSPVFPPSKDWTAAKWITPAVPKNVDGLSFGIAIGDRGSLTVYDLGLDDAAAPE